MYRMLSLTGQMTPAKVPGETHGASTFWNSLSETNKREDAARQADGQAGGGTRWMRLAARQGPSKGFLLAVMYETCGPFGLSAPRLP
ncbi:unnamed protein product [Lampetra fluviatilis]